MLERISSSMFWLIRPHIVVSAALHVGTAATKMQSQITAAVALSPFDLCFATIAKSAKAGIIDSAIWMTLTRTRPLK